MKEVVGTQDSMDAQLVCNAGIWDDLPVPKMRFKVQCFGPDGVLKWEEEAENLVLNAGRTDLLDKYLKGSAYTAAWYIILKGSGTIAAGDTLASHAGWSEVTPYAGNRPPITWGSTSTGTSTPSNTASTVTFSINATATVAGAGCCTVNTGTAGVLYNASDFPVARTVASGDTLTVTPTISVS